MTVTTDSEIAALDAVRTGDASAFGPIWDAYHSRLASFARRHSPYVDAEDLASHVLESTLSATLKGLGPTKSVWSYLVQSTRCEIARRAAAERSRRPLPEDVEVDVDPVSAEASDLLRDVIRSFAEQDQRVIVGAMAECRKTGAIAHELDRDPAWVSRRIHKLRPKLQQRWIQAHIHTSGAPDLCRKTLGAAGRVLSGQATERSTLRFWLHVDACDFCRPRIDDAQSASRRLGLVLPVLAAPGVLKPALSGSAAGAVGSSAGGGTASGASAAQGLAHGTMQLTVKGALLTVGGVAAAGAVVTVLLGFTGIGPFAVGPDGHGAEAPNAVQGPASGQSNDQGDAGDDARGGDASGGQGQGLPGRQNTSASEGDENTHTARQGSQDAQGSAGGSSENDPERRATEQAREPGQTPAHTPAPDSTADTRPCSWAPQLQCEINNG